MHGICSRGGIQDLGSNSVYVSVFNRSFAPKKADGRINADQLKRASLVPSWARLSRSYFFPHPGWIVLGSSRLV
ncbi:hypothetical protein BVRB_4g079880 [Beta vulgaris subsp. vulgaris]|nr:hypothetical protein BVRB_4g079880 [Beta vulgaris subsp. vulgaris]